MQPMTIVESFRVAPRGRLSRPLASSDPDLEEELQSVYQKHEQTKLFLQLIIRDLVHPAE